MYKKVDNPNINKVYIQIAPNMFLSKEPVQNVQ